MAKRWMNVAAKHGVPLGGVTTVPPELVKRCPACFNTDIYGRSLLEYVVHPLTQDLET